MLTNNQRVMIAIGNEAPRAFLSDNLLADGYDARATSSLGHACSRLFDGFEALIVDLGVESTKLIDSVRADLLPSVDPQLPIIALTESADEFHRIRLLERGADDVLSDPWIYPELRARLAALLRRFDPERPREILRVGALRVDVRGRRVWIAETELVLPSKEFELLRVLISEPGRLFTRAELLHTVWGWDEDTVASAYTRTLDSHASRLRRRLATTGESFVHCCWGVGYRLSNGVIPS